jgi:hypothetical protein
MLSGVRHSVFWTLMDDEFGSAYARTLAATWSSAGWATAPQSSPRGRRAASLGLGRGL